jgi:hypothetical protein
MSYCSGMHRVGWCCAEGSCRSAVLVAASVVCCVPVVGNQASGSSSRYVVGE